MPTISLEGALANTVIGDLIVIVGTIGRFWMLRGQSRSRAKLVSDMLFLSFSVLVMGNSVGMYKIYLRELKVKNEEGLEMVAKKVVDEDYLKIVYSVGVIYIIQMWCLKGAFLALFYDMHRYFTRNLTILLWSTILFVGSTFITVLMFQFLRCQPLNTNWTLDREKSCSVMLSMPGVIVMSWSNIVSDMAILIIGLRIIWSLQIRQTERSGLFVVAFIGAISIMATIMRFVFCYMVARDGAAEFVVVHEIFTWSSIEIVMAFMAFCLPALKALFNRRRAAREANTARTKQSSGGFMTSIRSRGNTHKSEITVLETINVESESMGSRVELRMQGGMGPMGYENLEDAGGHARMKTTASAGR